MIRFRIAETILIEVNTRNVNLLICTLYRPTTFDVWDNVNDNLEQVKSLNRASLKLLLGDLNADFKTNDGKKLVELCTS